MKYKNNYGLDKWLSSKTPLYKQLYDYYAWCDQTKGFTYSTMRHKVQDIRRFFQFAGVTDVKQTTNDMVDRWMGFNRQQGVSGRAINDYYKHVRAMLVWMKDCDVKIPGIKIARLSRTKEEPAKRNWFTEEQIVKVLSYADRREWLLVKLAFDCGFRISELRTLRLSNIKSLNEGRYMQIIGKGRKERSCIMSEEARTRLNDWIEREHITDWLWPNPRGTGPITDNACREAMKKPFRAAGFYNMTPHDLRRSYATDCKIKGCSDEEIQHGMGHADVKTTTIYLKQTYDTEVLSLYERKYQLTPAELR